MGEDGELEFNDVTSLSTFTLSRDRLEFFGLSEARLAHAVALVERQRSVNGFMSRLEKRCMPSRSVASAGAGTSGGLAQVGRMRTGDGRCEERRDRSSWSEVSTLAPDAPATKTTWASTTSDAPAAPSRAPTA